MINILETRNEKNYTRKMKNEKCGLNVLLQKKIDIVSKLKRINA